MSKNGRLVGSKRTNSRRYAERSGPVTVRRIGEERDQATILSPPPREPRLPKAQREKITMAELERRHALRGAVVDCQCRSCQNSRRDQ